MDSKAVIGLGFGDEGKGITTDYLCSQSENPLVIRYSGGQQAGHTVYFKKLKHVFSNFGSGTLRNIPTYWSKYCTVDPVGIINELTLLINKGINPVLYIDANSPITTPYDIVFNQSNDFINGTCGVGVGTTIQREQDLYSLTFSDLFIKSILSIKLQLISDYYNLEQDISLNEFYEAVFQLTSFDNIKLSNKIPIGYSDYIFEGSQGLLLDQNIGFFPNVTRSNTGSKNILSLRHKPWVYLITRAYQTRHGNGHMTNENIPHNINLNTNETNVTNKYQGEFKVSLLDLDLLLYGINKDEYIKNTYKKTLVITCLDQMKNEFRFTYKSKIVYCDNENDFISRIKKILNIDSVLISKSPYSENIKLCK